MDVFARDYLIKKMNEVSWLICLRWGLPSRMIVHGGFVPMNELELWKLEMKLVMKTAVIIERH